MSLKLLFPDRQPLEAPEPDASVIDVVDYVDAAMLDVRPAAHLASQALREAAGFRTNISRKSAVLAWGSS